MIGFHTWGEFLGTCCLALVVGTFVAHRVGSRRRRLRHARSLYIAAMVRERERAQREGRLG